MCTRSVVSPTFGRSGLQTYTACAATLTYIFARQISCCVTYILARQVSCCAPYYRHCLLDPLMVLTDMNVKMENEISPEPGTAYAVTLCVVTLTRLPCVQEGATDGPVLEQGSAKP